jgi:hypothetical protein
MVKPVEIVIKVDRTGLGASSKPKPSAADPSTWGDDSWI